MDEKKVLIVEDSEIYQKEWKKRLSGKVKILSAFTIEKAKKIFSENSDIALIVVDSCVPGVKINTQPLVRKFRESFKGPMIAASSGFYNKEKLTSAGCNHRSDKDGVPGKIREVLSL